MHDAHVAGPSEDVRPRTDLRPPGGLAPPPPPAAARPRRRGRSSMALEPQGCATIGGGIVLQRTCGPHGSGCFMRVVSLCMHSVHACLHQAHMPIFICAVVCELASIAVALAHPFRVTHRTAQGEAPERVRLRPFAIGTVSAHPRPSGRTCTLHGVMRSRRCTPCLEWTCCP